MGRLADGKHHFLSLLKQGDWGTAFPQELEQILSFEPYGGSVVIGMNADQTGTLFANWPEDSDWVVLPVTNLDCYFGNTNFGRKYLNQLPGRSLSGATVSVSAGIG